MPVKTIPLPSQGALLGLLDYNPATGVLTRKFNPAIPMRSNKQYAGKAAGCKATGHGYISVWILGRSYLAQRLIWKMLHGYDPVEMDHKDLDRANNRQRNLRPADHCKNNQNHRKTRPVHKLPRGVNYNNGERDQFIAQISVNKKRYYLGAFGSSRSAHQAYARAARRLHGEFARVA